ncbi:MAG: hypothetical protein J6M62_03665 [Selenomonadaceae bacterium]|nr:hypothetical protein [Selenomonadaceae bacterium]MBO6304164.1 hypothetical protein [Selenomonadaceae bacterium]
MASSSNFALAHGNGNANINVASNAGANGGIRPLLVGANRKKRQPHGRE